MYVVKKKRICEFKKMPITIAIAAETTIQLILEWWWTSSLFTRFFTQECLLSGLTDLN